MAKVMIIHEFGGWSDAIRWTRWRLELGLPLLAKFKGTFNSSTRSISHLLALAGNHPSNRLSKTMIRF